MKFRYLEYNGRWPLHHVYGDDIVLINLLLSAVCCECSEETLHSRENEGKH